jgi:biopolymer transport protein ExbB
MPQTTTATIAQTFTLAQTEGAGGTGALWDLFIQSFDVFTVALLAGSLYATGAIVRAALDIREKNVFDATAADRARSLAERGLWGELRNLVRDDEGFLGAVLGAALGAAHRGRGEMHDAAEIAASEQTSGWFRRIEPLSLVGNLGPLVGLAGTVWGMILAFTSLGATAGQAGPAELSEGISKALFHTLLGLCLAIPCLLVFGAYRAKIDRLCTRAIAESARIVGMIPAGDDCPDEFRPRPNGRGDGA